MDQNDSIQKIHFIINPASGRPAPVLHTINAVCEKHGCDWSVAVTRKGDVGRIAREAAQSDADIVAVYGGDGTVAAVAGQIYETGKTLGVLPGGTANVLSHELNIPFNIHQACARVCDPQARIKRIDIGRVCGRYFLSRIGLGFEGELIKGADRTSKTRMGWLAYAFSGFRAVFKTQVAHYDMTLDGEHVRAKGVSLVVANSGNLGLSGLTFSPDVDISDGKLNVILIRTADLNVLFSAEQQEKDIPEDALSLFQHWTAQKIVIEPGYKQAVQYDGEILSGEKLDIEVLPQALNVLC